MNSTTSSSAFLFLIPSLLFLLEGGLAEWRAPRTPRRFGSLGMSLVWLNLAAALLGALWVPLQGMAFSPTLGPAGWGASLRLDPLTATVWLMVSLLAVVIYRYSRTYLEGDPRHGVFLGRLLMTIGCVQTLVLSGNLGLLFVSWICTSLSLHRLLVFYPERRAARLAAWKKFVAARIGDVALFGAVMTLTSQFGTGDLQSIFDAVSSRNPGEYAGALSISGFLIAMAALLKSAQFPLHGWLVEVMETPTPVSALLHAGVLNAGPYLAVRMSPILHEATGASVLLVIVGGFTGWFASTVLLTQPSVKVALGYSSAAHMGFMLMVAGLGVYPAVMLHLVAHSFYKAHAFLSSGSVVEQAAVKGVPLPARLGSLRRVAGSLGIALAVYVLFAWLWGVHPLQRPSLLAVGAILVLGLGQMIAPALDSRGPRSATVRACLMAVGVAVLFFTLEAAAHGILHPVLPELSTPPAAVLILAAATVLLYQAAVLIQMFLPLLSAHPGLHAWSIHLRNGLYANALLDRLAGSLKPSTHS